MNKKTRHEIPFCEVSLESNQEMINCPITDKPSLYQWAYFIWQVSIIECTSTKITDIFSSSLYSSFLELGKLDIREEAS